MTNNTQQNSNFNSNGGERPDNAYVWLNPHYNTERQTKSGGTYIDGLFGTAIVYFRGLCIRGIQIRVSKAGDTYLVFPNHAVYENGMIKKDANGYQVREDYVSPTSRDVRQEIQSLVDSAIEKKMAEMQQNQ